MCITVRAVSRGIGVVGRCELPVTSSGLQSLVTSLLDAAPSGVWSPTSSTSPSAPEEPSSRPRAHKPVFPHRKLCLLFFTYFLRPAFNARPLQDGLREEQNATTPTQPIIARRVRSQPCCRRRCYGQRTTSSKWVRQCRYWQTKTTLNKRLRNRTTGCHERYVDNTWTCSGVIR